MDFEGMLTGLWNETRSYVDAVFIPPTHTHQTGRVATRHGQTNINITCGVYQGRRLDITQSSTSIVVIAVAAEYIESTVVVMPPKPSSTTGGKAPASGTAAKQPAKTVESAKGAKKTAKTAAPPAGGEEKKKRRKPRKETYSSYIFKGALLVRRICVSLIAIPSPQASPS